MGIVQTIPCQSCRYPMMVARTGLPLFRSAKGRRLRLFLRSRDNSVRETNAQPAPVTGLFTGFGVRPQQAETAVSGIAGNRSFESLWEQRHCLQSSVLPVKSPTSTSPFSGGPQYGRRAFAAVRAGLIAEGLVESHSRSGSGSSSRPSAPFPFCK